MDLFNGMIPLGFGAGAGGAALQQYQPIDSRTDRQKLEDKLQQNKTTIKSLEIQNVEIIEALKLLDEHPMIEKMKDLIVKLVGR